MKKTRAMARLGLLALGLGFGGAVASIPATASADASSWLSEVSDFLSTAFPAASGSSGLNLAISINGTELFQSGTAEAYSGTNSDIAIAHGAGSLAYAFGSNDHASAYGDGSTAVAGGENALQATGSSADSAVVVGNDSYAFAGGSYGDLNYDGNPGTQDYALIFGNGDTALSGGNALGAGAGDGTYVEGSFLRTAEAQGADYLVDFVKNYGGSSSSTSSAAADLVGADTTGALADGHTFWADLFTGDTAGALTAGQDFWADLLPGLDAGGTVADGSGIWAELLASFDGGSFAADASNLWTELTTLF